MSELTQTAAGAAEDTADPVDVTVGANVRNRRKFLGMSQGELSSALGLSFQQVQKYERGLNRISASMMFKIARKLNCTVLDLYAGCNDLAGDAAPQAETAAETPAMVTWVDHARDLEFRRPGLLDGLARLEPHFLDAVVNITGSLLGTKVAA